MSGEVNCRAVRPLFRYLNECGVHLDDLLEEFRGKEELLSIDGWISAGQFSDLLDRAAALSGEADLTARVGEAAAVPCPFGLLTPDSAQVGSPEALLQQADGFLGLLQRDGQVTVRSCQPGRAVLECVPPPGERRGHHLCTYTRHLLRTIPNLWEIQGAEVREVCCAVPLAELRLPSGSRCSVDDQGNLWEVADRDGVPERLPLGPLQEDGTLCLGGTLYGADRCVYEVAWPAAPAGWRRVVPRFPWLRRPPFRELQRQQQVIQALREQIQHLDRTMEARILERTEALRGKARQMALVEQAGRRFASILDPEALLREAVRTLREEFGYFTVALYLLEGSEWSLRALATGDQTVLQQPAQAVYPRPEAREKLQSTSRPLVQGNVAGQPHSFGLPRLGRGCSAMTAPLIVADHLLGALDLQSPLPDSFDEDDALLLHTVATQVAITLERGRLYREEQRARHRADAMAVLARVVTTSLELDQVLPLALDQIRRVLPCDAAVVLLLEEGRLVPAASSGLTPEASQSLGALFDPALRAPFARLLEEMDTLLATIPPSLAGMMFPELAVFASWLGTPLTSRGVAVGVTLLASREAGAYGEKELRIAEDLAGQVATAIENARLYGRIRQERDRQETLYEIARDLNADLGIEQVLRHILELGQASVGGIAGSILLLDSAGRPTHSILSRPDPVAPAFFQEILSRGAAGWVMREQKGVLIRDTSTDPRWLTLPDDPWATRSAIVVPMIAQGQTIGILTVAHAQVDRFDQDDLDLLTSIAEQASTVVQRAHLFTAVWEERARLETVIEGTADAVIVLDEGGQVLHMNRSAAGLFALGDAVPSGRDLAEVVQHPALEEILRQPRGSSDRTRSEVPLPDGRTFYATLTPIPGVGGVITMQDITHLKELDRMKSDFVATVSHDLRTPLSAVQGFAEMLEVAGPLNEDQRRFRQRILHSVDGMTALVGDLLDLAKIEAGVEMAMAPCQLAAVIAEAVDQWSMAASAKPVGLRIEVSEDLPLVWGNGRRLGQVVGNLLDNAIKYAPRGGKVVLQSHVEGDSLQVDVADNGPGIPPADLRRVFEKFFRSRRVDHEVPGTGLGLSIARSIVQAHSGRIWAESTPGEGTTFSFSIPLWVDESPGPRDQGA